MSYYNNIAYNLLTDCLWARKYVVLHTQEPFNAQHDRRGSITPILQVTESRANRQLAQSSITNVTGGELRFNARSVWLQHALNYCDQLLSKQQVLSSIDQMMEEEDTDSSVHTGQVGNRTSQSKCSVTWWGPEPAEKRVSLPARSTAWPSTCLCVHPGAQAC